LVAFVVLAVLVAFALNRVDGRRRAYVALMQSDLRNLMTAEESYFSEHNTYGDPSQLSFKPSVGVELVEASYGAGGWSARVAHQKRTDVWCAVFMGTSHPIFSPAEVAGVITCGPKDGS
jgi:hypothetical protein